jgi:DNA-binding HxlR family transcriptional regulator
MVEPVNSLGSGRCPVSEKTRLDSPTIISYFANDARRTHAMSAANHPFRALGDETRRDILRLLRRGSLTSGQIAERFDSSWPTISRHLAVLRAADLVTAQRHGQEIRYELNTSVFQDLIHLLMEWAGPPSGAARRTATPRKSRKQEA